MRTQATSTLLRLIICFISCLFVMNPASSENAPSNQSQCLIIENTLHYQGEAYRIISVEGGNRSGYRAKKVAVDVGFGSRLYWALTNEHGQLIHVLASRITLQNDATDPVNRQGRYYDDEANVEGTEHPDLDQGHVIADSLGGVSNAYNITPQDSALNRHGDQAYMEKAIRTAGGCSDFVATITYPNSRTQIPSRYQYEYTLRGNRIKEEFTNTNPDKYNEEHGIYKDRPQILGDGRLEDVDTNSNGRVTIKEAKAAGYRMPISSKHWLYRYMHDADGDGFVGE